MNLGDLQTLVLSWLDDPLAAYFTLPQVNVWLNNAQRECAKQLVQAGENYYTQLATSSTVANQATYDLPEDFLKVDKFQVVISGTTPNECTRTLAPVTLVDLDASSQGPASPQFYAIKKNCFILRPIPDIIYPLKLYYSYRVVDMVSTSDVPDVPIQYQEYLAVLATFDGLLKDQRDPGPMLTKRQYYLDLMKQDASERTVDAPRMVRELDGYQGGYFF